MLCECERYRYSRAPHLPLVPFGHGLQLVDFALSFKHGPAAISTAISTAAADDDDDARVFTFAVAVKNLGGGGGGEGAHVRKQPRSTKQTGFVCSPALPFHHTHSPHPPRSTMWGLANRAR